MSVNNDFATQVIYLAQVLGCSERYVAGLMQYVISNNPNFSPVNILEQGVLEYHRR
jgi:nuclear pore complex protein Nup205